MGRLDGKVAVITGGASGMGEATTKLFVAEGAQVVIGDVQREKAQALADSLGDDCVAVEADVSSSEDVQALVRTALSEFGGIDVMYNNAGIGGGEGPIHECSEEMFDRIIAVDLKAVWLGMKHALPHLIDRGGAVDHHDRLDLRPRRHARAGRLRLGEGRCAAADEGLRHRIRRPRYPRQQHLPGRHPDTAAVEQSGTVSAPRSG